MLAPSSLTALAIVILAALVCGMIMTRLRQPAAVGYILAGVILGPSVFPVVEQRENVTFLAELGVLMLLFFIGMELSLRGFRAVWKTAIGTVLLQVGVSLSVFLSFSYLFDLPVPVAVLFAFVIALSSTAVVVKMLEQMNILRSPVGQLTLGVLIAQDLAVVPMMLIIGALGRGDGLDPAAFGKILVAVALIAGLIWYLSRRQRITLPFARVVVGNVDLTPLSGLAFCFGAAAVSGLAGLSPAFGAFFAGLVIGNSTGRPMMIRSTRPIQSVLLMVFFLSIGLLIDLRFIWEHIGTVILLLLSVMVLKTAINIGALHLLKEPWPHAFIAGIMLAQIGEFSFVLGTAGLSAGVISDAQNSLIVAVAAFSLLFSPLWQIAARRALRVLLLSVTSLTETLRTAAGRQGHLALTIAERAGEFLRRLADSRKESEAPDSETMANDTKPKSESEEMKESAEIIDLPAKDETSKRAGGHA